MDAIKHGWPHALIWIALALLAIPVIIDGVKLLGGPQWMQYTYNLVYIAVIVPLGVAFCVPEK